MLDGTLVTQLQVTDAQFVREADRPVDEAPRRLVVRGDDATGVEVRQADEEAAEEEAAHEYERQQADRPVALRGFEQIRLVAQSVLEDRQPIHVPAERRRPRPRHELREAREVT